jgi:hypothetical protein
MRTALAFIAVITSFTPNAHACYIVNFAYDAARGNLGYTENLSKVTVSGWAVDKANPASWTPANINNRNEPSDKGLGVCPLGQVCPPTGNGDINEIDNNGMTFDVLRLAPAAGFILTSVSLSSLDSGTKDNFAIFGSNTVNPVFSSLTLLAQGSNATTHSTAPAISVNPNYAYYYVTTQARGANDSNSDFLVSGIALERGQICPGPTPTPEPATSAMIGAGLLVAGGLLRRRTRSGN